MAQVTYDDVKALVAFSIYNNRNGVISALNQAGYRVSDNISNTDLYNQLLSVFTKTGINGLQLVLSRVTIDKTRTEHLTDIYNTFQGTEPTRGAKINLDSIGTWIGDLLGGHTTVDPTTTTNTTEPLIKPGTIIGLAIFGVVMITVLMFVALRKAS